MLPNEFGQSGFVSFRECLQHGAVISDRFPDRRGIQEFSTVFPVEHQDQHLSEDFENAVAGGFHEFEVKVQVQTVRFLRFRGFHPVDDSAQVFEHFRCDPADEKRNLGGFQKQPGLFQFLESVSGDLKLKGQRLPDIETVRLFDKGPPLCRPLQNPEKTQVNDNFPDRAARNVKPFRQFQFSGQTIPGLKAFRNQPLLKRVKKFLTHSFLISFVCFYILICLTNKDNTVFPECKFRQTEKEEKFCPIA